MSAEEYEHLGYDPRPDLCVWKGTHIPKILQPLKLTARRGKIAEYIWCNGPPWTVLRNAHTYLYHILDHATDEDLEFTITDVSKDLWCSAIKNAKQGDLSKGAYIATGLQLGLFKPGVHCSWSDRAHYQDFRPNANQTREEFYNRFKPLDPELAKYFDDNISK